MIKQADKPSLPEDDSDVDISDVDFVVVSSTEIKML